MKQKILLIGDSFGADWSQCDLSYPGWPQLLGKKYEIHNLAQAGCGEYRVLQQLKSQTNLDEYQWIIVCHTSATRIHTKRHPVHANSIMHQHCDLIFSDIESHAKKTKNPAIDSASNFFKYHYDEDYQVQIYHLIVNEIDKILQDRNVIVADNFEHLDKCNYKNYLRFKDITELQSGQINHSTADGNIAICQAILDIINPSEKILPEVILKSLRLAEFEYFTPDDPKDQQLSTSYPYPVYYNFNSRGFRDIEWPDQSQLSTSIWCIGDSATLGIGSCYEHSWPEQLGVKTQHRTIKIAMAGASNDWIFRKAKDILQQIGPQVIVLHWSRLYRREKSINDMEKDREIQWQKHYNNIKDASWPDCSYKEIHNLPYEIQTELCYGHASDILQYANQQSFRDEDRRLCEPDLSITDQQNIDHTINIIQQLEAMRNNTVLIHSVVPEFADNDIIKELFENELKNFPINFIPEFQVQDHARDNQHYDVKTSIFFVSKIINFLQKLP